MIKVLAVFLGAVLMTAVLPAAARADDKGYAGVQEMLDSRVKAVAADDEKAFMQTVDEKADPAFRDQQRRMFRGLSTLPLRTFTMKALTVDAVDAAPALGLAYEYDAEGAYLPETEQLLQIDGYDDRPAIDSLWYTYVKRSGRWYVAADNDAESIGLFSSRNIWDLTDIAVRTTEHYMTVHALGQDRRAEDLDGVAENAMSIFNQRWSRPWSQRLPIVLPASDGQARQLLDTDAEVAEFVAFVSYRTVRDNGWTAGAPRMLSQDDNFDRGSRSSQVDTVVHELTHAATSTLTGPFTPSWLQEGLAEYMRSGLPTERAPGSKGALNLPAASEFGTTGSQLLNAYYDAASAMSYLALRYGPDAPAALFETLGARRLSPGTPSYNVDQAFRQVTGESSETFVRSWNQHYGR